MSQKENQKESNKESKKRNLIAILRGVRPSEVEGIVGVLLDAGITKIEVPLNSPDPFASIALMVKAFAGRGIFGAGTVLTLDQVARLADLGAQMVVSPNCDIEVIRASKAAGLLSYPGVMTPSECFQALKGGADGLKFFPGDIIAPAGLRAMRAVLPPDVDCIAVGGAHPSNFDEWHKAGATGFGVGSSLYKAGDTSSVVAQKAKEILLAYDGISR